MPGPLPVTPPVRLGRHEAHVPVRPWHRHKLSKAARHGEAWLPLGLANGGPIPRTLPAVATAQDEGHCNPITNLAKPCIEAPHRA